MDDIIYIVEDDEGIRELYEGAFEGVFLTKMFENGKDFFACFENARPSLIILDIMLPDMDGYTILTKIREMDEKFSNGLLYPSDPNGQASEVCNCRCALIQRARWALDESELATLKERAEYYGIDKSDNFIQFRQKFLNIEKG